MALSSVAVSLWPNVIRGSSFSTSSPRASDESMASRAAIQFSFPCSVLISPLCMAWRYGCANFHDPRVLVLKREWTMANDVTTDSSERSG